MPGSVVALWPTGPARTRRNYRVDCGKIADLLPSAAPQWTVDDGTRQLYEAYRAHGLTIDDVTRRYVRIERVKALQVDGLLDGELRWTGAAHPRADGAPGRAAVVR